MDDSPDAGRISPSRFAARIALAALEIALVVLLGTGGVKFFYQGF
ncbi:MAG TPA: hypothetical protein VGH33_17185 [Isosphaeraceae bacterium]